jgi:hypothetical protein
MKVDLSKDGLGTTLILQTKDWGLYAIRQFAIPDVDLETDTFTGAQNPQLENVIGALEKYGNLWIMKNKLKYGYPTEYLRDQSVISIEDKYFEKIFEKNEIRKISCEPIKFTDWATSKGVYTIKAPKETILGAFGAYLDKTFK